MIAINIDVLCSWINNFERCNKLYYECKALLHCTTSVYHLSTTHSNYVFKLLIFTIQFSRPHDGLPCVAAAAVTAACYALPLCGLLAPLHIYVSGKVGSWVFGLYRRCSGSLTLLLSIKFFAVFVICLWREARIVYITCCSDRSQYSSSLLSSIHLSMSPRSLLLFYDSNGLGVIEGGIAFANSPEGTV